MQPTYFGGATDDANESIDMPTAAASAGTGALDVRPASFPLLATAPVHRKSFPYPRHSLPAFVHLVHCGYERSHRSRCRRQLWQGFAGVSAMVHRDKVVFLLDGAPGGGGEIAAGGERQRTHARRARLGGKNASRKTAQSWRIARSGYFSRDMSPKVSPWCDDVQLCLTQALA